MIHKDWKVVSYEQIIVSVGAAKYVWACVLQSMSIMCVCVDVMYHMCVCVCRLTHVCA